MLSILYSIRLNGQTGIQNVTVNVTNVCMSEFESLIYKAFNL